MYQEYMHIRYSALTNQCDGNLLHYESRKWIYLAASPANDSLIKKYVHRQASTLTSFFSMCGAQVLKVGVAARSFEAKCRIPGTHIMHQNVLEYGFFNILMT